MFPNIQALTLNIATSNGILNRTTTAERIIEVAESCLQADGVYSKDVEKLETWLGTLSIEQMDNLADGEQDDMNEVAALAPISINGTQRVSDLITDIYEAISERA